MPDQVKREVVLVVPISPNMELAAAQTGSILAEIMNFEENHIDEIQFAIIETCINAFEHSKSKDGRVFIKFIMKDDELELRITDHGVGFRLNQVNAKEKNGAIGEEMRKRGWGLNIIRNMMDNVNIESSNKGTTITMVKKKIAAKSA